MINLFYSLGAFFLACRLSNSSLSSSFCSVHIPPTSSSSSFSFSLFSVLKTISVEGRQRGKEERERERARDREHKLSQLLLLLHEQLLLLLQWPREAASLSTHECRHASSLGNSIFLLLLLLLLSPFRAFLDPKLLLLLLLLLLPSMEGKPVYYSSAAVCNITYVQASCSYSLKQTEARTDVSRKKG